MICTILVNSEKTKYFYENRDCLDWQPLSLITPEIKNYIEAPKNETLRLQRFSAYISLFSAAKQLFGVKICEIERGRHGKPRIKFSDATEGLRALCNKNFCFSISHSSDLCAVALSDEGEVGVDIQSKIEKTASERLNKKYFDRISFTPKLFKINYFEAVFSESGFALMPVETRGGKAPCPLNSFALTPSFDRSEGFRHHTPEEFMKRWTISEALLKCDGGGFTAIETLPSLAESLSYDSFYIKKNGEIFALSTAKSPICK